MLFRDNILHSASLTQITTDKSGKSDWILYDKEGNELDRFPGRLTEHEVMDILHFGRKYEKIAFNKGAEYERSMVPTKMKSLHNVVIQLRNENSNLLEHNKAMFEENDRIATKLNELLTSKL